MHKAEFLQALAAELSSLPQAEREKSLSFYAEAIDDRMEDGMAEADAVAAMGTVHEIVEKIMLDTPLPVLVRARARGAGGSSNRALTIVLAIVGLPIWLPLLVALAAVLFSIFVVIWSAVAVLWVVAFAIGLAGVTCVVACGFVLFLNGPSGFAMLGAGLVLAGLALLLFFPAFFATKGAAWLSAAIVRGVKRLFISKKGGAI